MDPIYEAEILNNIRHYSRYYIHGHSAGGTNPSLLEAMACQCNIIALDNVFNRAVLGEHALFFNSITGLSDELSKQADTRFVNWKRDNIDKITKKYNWEVVTHAYEELFYDALATK